MPFRCGCRYSSASGANRLLKLKHQDIAAGQRRTIDASSSPAALVTHCLLATPRPWYYPPGAAGERRTHDAW